MSAQSVNIIWIGYWPHGDVYPEEPVWSEQHASVGVGVDPAVEALIHADFVIPYGLEWSTTLDLVLLGLIDVELTPLDTYVYGSTESVMPPPFGWNTPLAFDVIELYDDLDAWTGEVKLTLPVSTQDKMGFDKSWRYQVRSFVDCDGVPTVLYIAAGQVVVRR